jgi:hypothetical protein
LCDYPSAASAAYDGMGLARSRSKKEVSEPDSVMKERSGLVVRAGVFIGILQGCNSSPPFVSLDGGSTATQDTSAFDAPTADGGRAAAPRRRSPP